MRLTLPATVLFVTGAAALLAVPAVLRAADESPHDAVERLMPQLLSDDDTLRTEAEKSLFQLGDAGRAELERLTRDTDPRRAVAALRLLQSPKWAKSAKPSGEQRVERDDGSEPQPGADRPDRVEDLRAQVERQLAEMRRQMERWDRSFTMPMPGFDAQAGALTPGSSGSIVENDRSTKWSVDADGRVKVTVKDGKDAPEEHYEAKDLDELKKEHPDVAKRIDGMLGRNRTFVFRSGPDQRLRLFNGQGGPRERVDPFQLDAPQAPVLGIEWTPVPDVLRDQVDLPAGGIVVESVVKDSLAEKLGLARHDVLVEIQGKPVSGSPDVRDALDAVKAGEKVTATVVRKGQKKTLEATK
jgi:hypothetical protein